MRVEIAEKVDISCFLTIIYRFNAKAEKNFFSKGSTFGLFLKFFLCSYLPKFQKMMISIIDATLLPHKYTHYLIIYYLSPSTLDKFGQRH